MSCTNTVNQPALHGSLIHMELYKNIIVIEVLNSLPQYYVADSINHHTMLLQ